MLTVRKVLTVFKSNKIIMNKLKNKNILEKIFVDSSRKILLVKNNHTRVAKARGSILKVQFMRATTLIRTIYEQSCKQDGRWKRCFFLFRKIFFSRPYIPTQTSKKLSMQKLHQHIFGGKYRGGSLLFSIVGWGSFSNNLSIFF